MPAGGAIILAAAVVFTVSLVFGSARGGLILFLNRLKLQRRLREVQFLRSAFDTLEKQQQIRLFVGHEFDRSLALAPIDQQTIVTKRDWTYSTVDRVINRLARKKLVKRVNGSQVQMTENGLDRAIEVARNHRLTELCLLNYADVAPQNVHQCMEKIEEVTTPEIADDLRTIFHEELTSHEIPQEPHKDR